MKAAIWPLVCVGEQQRFAHNLRDDVPLAAWREACACVRDPARVVEAVNGVRLLVAGTMGAAIANRSPLRAGDEALYAHPRTGLLATLEALAREDICMPFRQPYRHPVCDIGGALDTVISTRREYSPFFIDRTNPAVLRRLHDILFLGSIHTASGAPVDARAFAKDNGGLIAVAFKTLGMRPFRLPQRKISWEVLFRSKWPCIPLDPTVEGLLRDLIMMWLLDSGFVYPVNVRERARFTTAIFERRADKMSQFVSRFYIASGHPHAEKWWRDHNATIPGRWPARDPPPPPPPA